MLLIIEFSSSSEEIYKWYVQWLFDSIVQISKWVKQEWKGSISSFGKLLFLHTFSVFEDRSELWSPLPWPLMRDLPKKNDSGTQARGVSTLSKVLTKFSLSLSAIPNGDCPDVDCNSKYKIYKNNRYTQV